MTGHARIRAALARQLPAQPPPTGPLAVADRFQAALDGYAEVILGPKGRPVGFMTRGEDAAFTEAAQTTLTELGMPAEALAHHRTLAEWFEHQRAFFKVEWHDRGGHLEPLAACYFRRRPKVDEVATRMAQWGLPAETRELLFDVARALQKDTIHFVSAAFRPDHAVYHKLYFSQWVTLETEEQVNARLAAVFKIFGFQSQMQDWQRKHARNLRPGESTLFLSISLSADGIVPSFKLDYPEVGPARAALWLPASQATVIAEAEATRNFAGSPMLSYLGVRYAPDAILPSLKYYCDVPR